MTGRSSEISDSGARAHVFDSIGPFRLTAPDGADLTPLGRKARGLPAYLALNPGNAVSSEGERGEEQARASLCLYELRPLTGGEFTPLGVDRQQVELVPARIDTDLARFEALVAPNDAVAAPPSAAIALLTGTLFSRLPGIILKQPMTPSA